MALGAAARRDIVSAVAVAAVAVAYLVLNRRYPLDTMAAPGPGVFPLAVGLALLVLAASQLVVATRHRVSVVPAPGVPGHADRDTRWRHALPMLFVLVVYAAGLPVLGFFAASFTLVILSSRLLGARDWLRSLALAVGVTAAVYVIFVVWLRVPLPAGYLR